MLPSGHSVLRLCPRSASHTVPEAVLHDGNGDEQDSAGHHVCCHRPVGKVSTFENLPVLPCQANCNSRFSSHEFFAGVSPRLRGQIYARKSASLFDPSDVSLQSIQASVLLGACRIVEGDAPAESVYYGIACRMAQLLDLPHRACFSRLEREVNIRGMSIIFKVSAARAFLADTTSLAHPLHDRRVVINRRPGPKTDLSSSCGRTTSYGRDGIPTITKSRHDRHCRHRRLHGLIIVLTSGADDCAKPHPGRY